LTWPGAVRPAELVAGRLVAGVTDGPADADGTARPLGVMLTVPAAPGAPLLAA
jgi:hypothetical protein